MVFFNCIPQNQTLFQRFFFKEEIGLSIIPEMLGQNMVNILIINNFLKKKKSAGFVFKLQKAQLQYDVDFLILLRLLVWSYYAKLAQYLGIDVWVCCFFYYFFNIDGVYDRIKKTPLKCVYFYSCMFASWTSEDTVDVLSNDRMNVSRNTNQLTIYVVQSENLPPDCVLSTV